MPQSQPASNPARYRLLLWLTIILGIIMVLGWVLVFVTILTSSGNSKRQTPLASFPFPLSVEIGAEERLGGIALSDRWLVVAVEHTPAQNHPPSSNATGKIRLFIYDLENQSKKIPNISPRLLPSAALPPSTKDNLR